MTFLEKKMDHLRVHPGCLWWIFGEFSKAPMFSIQIPRRRNRLRTHLSHTPRKTPLKYESLIVAPLNIQIMNEIPLFFSTKKKLGVVASTSYTCIHQSIPGITIGWKKCKESTVDFKPKVFFFWGGGACFTTQLKILLPKSLVTQYSPNWDEKLANLVVAPQSFFP